MNVKPEQKQSKDQQPIATTSSHACTKPNVSGCLVNRNELIIPIDFKAIAKEHGVRKGNIFYSPTWKSWVLSGHIDIDLICIDAPFVKGQIAEGLEGKANRFNGKEIQNVIIRSNMWCAVF